jgi:hypothetical protein
MRSINDGPTTTPQILVSSSEAVTVDDEGARLQSDCKSTDFSGINEHQNEDKHLWQRRHKMQS